MSIPFFYNARVIYVHDGDTFYVVVDHGMYLYSGSDRSPIPLRIFGINARELSDTGGPEAKDNLALLMPVDTPVVLSTVKPDKYAPRWLASVSFGNVLDLSALLIAQQWAMPYFGSGVKPLPPWPRTVS